MDWGGGPSTDLPGTPLFRFWRRNGAIPRRLDPLTKSVRNWITRDFPAPATHAVRRRIGLYSGRPPTQFLIAFWTSAIRNRFPAFASYGSRGDPLVALSLGMPSRCPWGRYCAILLASHITDISSHGDTCLQHAWRHGRPVIAASVVPEIAKRRVASACVYDLACVRTGPPRRSRQGRRFRPSHGPPRGALRALRFFGAPDADLQSERDARRNEETAELRNPSRFISPIRSPSTRHGLCKRSIARA